MTLRKMPADFVVEELIAPEARAAWAKTWSAGTPFAVLRVRKESLTSPEAAGILCKALHVKSGSVEFAGLKDKHATTTQHMTAEIEAVRVPKLPTEYGGPRWSASIVGWASSHIRAEAIARNRFSIVVRDLSRRAVGAMNDRVTLLRAPTAGESPVSTVGLRVINYFGDQRFGSARHGKGFAARYLLKGDFEAALKLLIATPARKDSGARREFTRAAVAHWGQWAEMLEKLPKVAERGPIEVLAAGGTMKAAFGSLPNLVQVLCVESYQSFLWNSVARRLVDDECVRAKVKPVVAEDDFGAMHFAPGKAVPPGWTSLMVPMPAPETAVFGDVLVALDDVLRLEGLRLEQLAIPGLRRPAFGAADRPLVVEATSFTMSAAEKDELAAEKSPKHLKRRVEFELPRGAYATVVLRALGE